MKPGRSVLESDGYKQLFDCEGVFHHGPAPVELVKKEKI